MIMEASLIAWSRAQFAMTAAYHWLFVPLTLGLAMVMAIMETIYYIKGGDPFWKKLTKFWMKLFAINFAVGVATGLILEFEFGTNWSNYSWFVGDIFGAPLAIEGILAFFMEATFFAVMFFGWEKVSKKFHLTSTWLTGIGASVSAYWILVANGWMQNPTGTVFNPETMRNEMTSFIAVATNPVAVSKFFHAVFSGWMTGGVFTLGVSAWYLLKKREVKFAKKSMLIGSIVGLVGGIAVMLTGDSSAVHVYEYQPMKLAAAEGLKDGGEKAPFSIVPGVEIPGMLSFLATHDINGYVPGINNIIEGYTDKEGNKVLSVEEKISKGKEALSALSAYTKTRKIAPEEAAKHKAIVEANSEYIGYGYINEAEELIPNIPMVYWSFRLMVGLGSLLLLILIVCQYYLYKNKIEDKRWLLWVALWSIPLVYICGQAGWIVAEVGRQPWAIQDLLPVGAAISSLSVSAVQITFFVFILIFAFFLVAEIKILLKSIQKGPQIEEAIEDEIKEFQENKMQENELHIEENTTK